MFKIDKAGTVLANYGYKVPKKNLKDIHLKFIRSELRVQPANLYGEAEDFSIYREDSKYVYLPKRYGMVCFGDPEKRCLKYGIKTKYKFNGSLRDYQMEVIDHTIPELKDKLGGVINLSCGMGKTVLAIYIAHKMKLKTIVLTHRTELVNQWVERIEQFTDAKVGIIRGKKVNTKDKDIVITTLQSLTSKKSNYDPKIFEEFGLSIYDEVHHLGSKVFSTVFQIVKTKYTLGLTATPRRADGMYRVIEWCIGGIFYKLLRPPNSKVIVHQIEYFSKDSLFKEKRRWIPSKRRVAPDVMGMINKIQGIVSRNKMLAKVIFTLSKQDERQIIVLGKRIQQLKILYNLVKNHIDEAVSSEDLEENEITLAMYTGKQKPRELALAHLANIIFATYDKAEEGLDIKTLNTLVFATPKKDSEQSIGRIMRKEDEYVFPLIVDVIDKLSMFPEWAKLREKFYRKNKYKIHLDYAFNYDMVSKRDFVKKREKLSEQDLQENYPFIYKLNKDPINIDEVFKMKPSDFEEKGEEYLSPEPEHEDCEVLDLDDEFGLNDF